MLDDKLAVILWCLVFMLLTVIVSKFKDRVNRYRSKKKKDETALVKLEALLLLDKNYINHLPNLNLRAEYLVDISMFPEFTDIKKAKLERVDNDD